MKKIIIFILIICSIFTLNINADEMRAEDVVEEIDVCLTIEKEKYTYDEEILIIINGVTNENNPEFNFVEDGLVVVETNVTNNNTTLKVKKSNINKKSVLEIIITINNIDYYAKAYSYYDEQYGVFMSRLSYDDAFELYCDYLLNNNHITNDDYAYLRETHYSQYIDISTPTIAMTNMNGMYLMSEYTTTSVSGAINWKDDWGNIHPCQYLTVELIDNSLDTCIGTTITNADGEYIFNSENVNGLLDMAGYDLYLRIRADVEGVAVHNANNNVYYITTESQTINDVVIGNNYQNYNVLFEMNSDLGKAFQVLQAANTAYRYAKTMNTNSLYTLHPAVSKVQVHYPYDDGDNKVDNDGCVYRKAEKRIYICGDAKSIQSESDVKPYSDWDVIMHEYGHHIQQEFGISDSHGGYHDGLTNMSDHYYDDALKGETCESCKHLIDLDKCKEEGVKIAWGEGWATYFAFAAQDYYRTSLGNIKYIDTGVYDFYTNDFYDFISNTFCNGESCETTIIQLLYDLYDSNNSFYDTISLGHQNMWDYCILSNAVTLSEFIDYILTNNFVSFSELGKILSKLKISPSLMNVELLKLYNLPKFNWSSNDNSQYFPNNEFILVIADSNGNEILRKNNLSSTSYTLTELEWNQVLAAQGDTFKWRVIGSATKDYYTGPYSSGYQEQAKPSFNGTLIEGTSMSGTITSSVDYKWYKFTALSAGTYVFYTEGNVDTYGQLYNSLAYKDSTYNMISGAYNDNGGSSNNCLIEIDLTNGQIVYFKVKGVNNSIGNFTVQVHKHNYLYQWLNLTQHNKTCTCGEIIQEGHVVSSSSLNSGQTTAPCLLCGGMASIGFIEIQNNIIMISDNGSYILSNGIVVLVDSDIESYLNNTLVFRNPNEDIM